MLGRCKDVQEDTSRCAEVQIECKKYREIKRGAMSVGRQGKVGEGVGRCI